MDAESSRFDVERRRVSARTVLLILAAVGVVVGVSTLQHLTQRQVQEELAKIRAAGEPVTAADLEAFYALPANSRDATAIWTAALQTVSTSQFAQDSLD